MSEETPAGTTALTSPVPAVDPVTPTGDPPIADPSTTPEGAAAGDTPKGEGEEGAEGKTGDDEGAGKEGEKPAVPEAYEFTLPEGATLADEDREAFTALCKDLELSQDTAQKLLDKQFAGKQTAEQAAVAELDTVQQSWKDAQAADKEYGGKALKENIGLAVKALNQFGTPELVQVLNDSRLGDHPEVIRAFYRIGKMLAEDKHVAPAGEAGGEKTRGSRAYPHLASG